MFLPVNVQNNNIITKESYCYLKLCEEIGNFHEEFASLADNFKAKNRFILPISIKSIPDLPKLASPSKNIEIPAKLIESPVKIIGSPAKNIGCYTNVPESPAKNPEFYIICKRTPANLKMSELDTKIINRLYEKMRVLDSEICLISRV